MTSVLSHKAQPAHHLYIATGSADILTITNGAASSSFTVSSGAVLADMGKTVVLTSGTYKKVKLMPVASAMGTEANSYKTGYICMGDGSAAASSVAVLL